MALELAALGGSWPVAASLAAAVTARGLAAGRRRMALNEAMHELRRPLQALALGTGAAAPEAGLDSSLRMAVAALERLDREINGEGADGAAHRPLAAGPLLEDAARRWRGRASAAGASIGLRSAAGEARVCGDRAALERAVDNLLANAIEHGGSRVEIDAERAGGTLRLSVADSGRIGGGRKSGGAVRRALARLSGRRRRGHGLRVVRRVAAEHGGEFRLRAGPAGTVATIVLPLAGEDG
jgi:signal transduction histidine kinase